MRISKDTGVDLGRVAKHYNLSAMYGECNIQLRIVNPSDTCKYAELKERGME